MRDLLLPLMFAAGLCACTPTPAETARAATHDAAEQARLQHRLAGLVPGKPQDCINNFDTRDAQLSSYGHTILYSVTRNRVYRTDTNGLCTDVGSGGHNILITKSYTGQLCQGDIATTIDSASHFPSGSCSFGPFVRYTKP